MEGVLIKAQRLLQWFLLGIHISQGCSTRFSLLLNLEEQFLILINVFRKNYLVNLNKHEIIEFSKTNFSPSAWKTLEGLYYYYYGEM